MEICISNDSSPTSSNKNDVININLEHTRCKKKGGVFPTEKTTAHMY